MTTEIAVREQHATDLTIGAEQTFWSDKQVAVLKQLGLEEASNGDLAVFFHQAVRTGLDPFARQLYMIGRWSREGTKFTIQTGIDGYRLVARRAVDRAHETLEYEETLWCGKDGKWTDVWLSDDFPAAAKVVVIRGGQRFPAVALWKEYVQTGRNNEPNTMWSRMGANQLAKCAEALALRKAFPQDLSGIYTDDEMGQADARAEAEREQRSVRQKIAERDEHRAAPVPRGGRAVEGEVAVKAIPPVEVVVRSIAEATTPEAVDKIIARLEALGIEDTEVEDATLLGLATARRAAITEELATLRPVVEVLPPAPRPDGPLINEDSPSATAAPESDDDAIPEPPAYWSHEPDPAEDCKPSAARTGVLKTLTDLGEDDASLSTHFGRPVAQVATRWLRDRVKGVIAEQRAGQKAE